MELWQPGTKLIWTIGHSTRSVEEFIGLLKEFRVELLADIRSYPGSSRYPHFNKEPLKDTLLSEGLAYIHLEQLGGRRKVRRDSRNTAWTHPSFRGYADYMETGPFRDAVLQLEEMALTRPTAIMCAEALWWRCHRSLVSDYLKLRGWKVIHILGAGKTELHPYTRQARIVEGALDYSLHGEVPQSPELF